MSLFQPITYSHAYKKYSLALIKKVKSGTEKTAAFFVGKVQDQPFGLIMKGIAPGARWND
jgi:hypothetical protein